MNFPQLALAQVDAVFPGEGTIAVTFPHLATLSGVRVRVAQPSASARTGTFTLPQRGDFGLVGFYQNDVRSCVWIANLPSVTWNAHPAELWDADPRAQVTYAEGGAQVIRHGNGDVETAHPDGTLIRITHSKDGTVSNAGGRAAVTARKVTEPVGEARVPTRRPYAPDAPAPADLHVQHASGATLTITADGSVHARTARGHTIGLHDATEKARDAEHPHPVTATPEEDAQRVASEIIIQTEQGHRVTLHDDPILATDRYVKVTSAGGHEVILRDKPDADVHASVTTAAGQRVTLRDKPAGSAGIEAVTAAGLSVKLDNTAQTATVTAPTVIVQATTIKLGSAGASRKVMLDGDTGTDSRGDTYTLTGTTTKIFGE